MREHELRQLKKQTADFEEQNAVLSKHIDSIKSAIGKTDHFYYFPQKFSTIIFQCFGSVFIWYGSGSGSSILGWTTGSRVLMTKNKNKITTEKKLIFFYQKLQVTYP